MSNSVFSRAYSDMLAALTAARRDAGVTQVELSRRLGKPQPFISKVEHGVRRIDVIEFCAIAIALGLRPEALIGAIARAVEFEADVVGRVDPLAAAPVPAMSRARNRKAKPE